MVLLIITVIGSILAIIFIPKRISKLEMYTTSFFAIFLAAVADIYLDIKFDFYGFFNKGVDWQYLPIFVFVYPAANIVFLNFYPFKKAWMKKVLYIVIWTFLTTGFEYIALHTEVFYHNEWRLWYSFFCYPFLYLILVVNLRFIRFLAKNN
ncbi:CBO0543 family protein [Neobacillus rhizosphaerae]|uniref:CBO0543 family protein n=1 Tax=Neobacillus rhizosphaerae TaxID=2880965 RepID=UPI003D2D4CEC